VRKEPKTTYLQHGKPQKLEGKGVEFGECGEGRSKFPFENHNY